MKLSLWNAGWFLGFPIAFIVPFSTFSYLSTLRFQHGTEFVRTAREG